MMSSKLVAPLSMFSEHDGVLEVVQVVGDDSHSKRLSELGFCAGSRLRVIKHGEPAILSIGGSRFALAADLQNRIFARPVDA